MGRIIGLIGGTCRVIALLRLTNLQHGNQTLMGGVETPATRSQLSPRDGYRKGKEQYLRGHYEEAVKLLEGAVASTSGLTNVDRLQAEDYLGRARTKLAERATGVRAQSPEADPFAFPEETPVSDATRTRVERLMSQAQAAAQAGNRAEAIKLAQQANQIVKASPMTFHKGEMTPAQLLALLEGKAAPPAGVAGKATTGDLPEWADSQPGVQQAGGAAPAAPFGAITFTGNVEEAPEQPQRAAPVSGNAKTQANALLEAARKDLKAGRFDEARHKALEAESLGVAYDLFDDRPELVLADLDRRGGTLTLAKRTEPAAPAAPAANAQNESPKAQAVKLLELARLDLKNGNVEGAKSKAEQAQALNVAYKLFEDRPELVMNDAAAVMAASNLANNSAIPKANPLAEEPAAAVADSKTQARKLLAQSRQALADGRIDEARQLAIEAERLKASYGLFDDRPEIVLADIARIATRGTAAAVPNPATTKPAAAFPEENPTIAQVKPEAVTPKATITAKPNGPKPSAGTTARAESTKLLREARQLMQAGRLEEARAKAEAADRLNVAYDVLADRPDLILAEIDKATNGNIAAKPSRTKPEAGSVMTADAQFGGTNTTPGTTLAANEQAAGPFQELAAVPAAIPTGLSALELYNRGMAELSRGNRDAAHQAFLAAHQSGQRLDPVRAQRIQDYVRELAPKPNKIQLTNNQIGDADVAPLTVGGTEDPSPLDAMQQQQSVKFDRLRTETLNAVFRAERLREKDPEQALQIVDVAMANVEGAELSPEATGALLKSLTRTRTSLQNEIERQQPNLEMKRKNEEVLSAVQRDANNKLRIEQEFAKLVEEFNTVYEQRRFADAEVIAKKAKELDPRNPVSETLFWKAKFARRIDATEQMKEGKENAVYETLFDVEKGLVFNVGDDRPMDFPKNWDQITKTRKGKYRADNRTRSDADLRIEQSLERRISLHEDNVPLAEVIRKIATIADINIVFDQLGLEDEQVTSTRPVTLDVEGIKVKSALNLILQPLHLGYVIHDEVLNITSQMRQQGELVVATYPVADLVVPIPSFAPTMSNPLNVTGMGSVGGGNGQMSVPPGMPGGQPFAQVGPDAAGPMAGLAGTDRLGGSGPTVDFDTLVELITTTIAPDTWQEIGGPGSIRQFETTLSLVVRQTQQVHEEIADLLEQLRRLQDLQVTIEVRFVTVSDRFFERIGIDFDFNIQDTVGGPNVDNANIPLLPFGSVLIPQSGAAGNVAGQAQAQAQQGQANQAGTSQFFTVPGPTRQLTNVDRYPNGGTIVGLANPGQFSTDLDVPFRQGSFEVGVPTFGGFNPNAGMQVGLAVLSDIEAFFFIQAAQGDARTNLLFAPKVTLFNGQTASVNSTVTRPFVISLIPTVGFFSTGFQPVIQFFPDGVQLFVQAVISADRRFVRLTVTPFFTNITDVFTFSFVGGAGANVQGQQGQGQQQQGQQGFGGGQQGGFGGGQFGIGGGMGTAQLVMNSLFTQQNQQGNQGQQGQRNQQGGNGLSVTVQQPVLEIVTVNTTVSVPDGGTVLLGGVKRLREGRNMSGVPILNKIPYVSRLFKNTGVGRETESVMLMVTPRIIIQEEEEELLGIPTE